MGNSNNQNLYSNNNYWEAIFSSFIKLKNFSENFKAKKKTINQDSPIYNILYNIFTYNKDKHECIQEFKNIIRSKHNNEQLTNPKKLFNFFIESIHKELKEENSQESLIPSIEYMNDDKRAYELYMEYAKYDRSIIQKNFFGTKKITIICQSCKSIFYVYDYLKFIPLDLQNIQGMIKIEYLYKNIQREFIKNMFCRICNKIKNFKIKITIIEKPETLIFFLYNYHNNAFVDFDYKFGNDYYLKSFVMRHDDPNILNKFLCQNNKKFVSYGREKDKFYKFEKDQIKYVENKEIVKGNGNPDILFYKIEKDKKDEEINDIKNGINAICDSKEPLPSNNKFKNKKSIRISSNQFECKIERKNENKKNISKSVNDNNSVLNGLINYQNESNTSEIIINSNSKANLNDLNNINENTDINNNTIIYNNQSISISNSIKNSINTNKINKNNLIYKSMNDNIFINKSNNSLSSEREKTIRLYFKYNNGDIFFIDVSEFMNFENIKIELKKAYEWINIENAILYYNGKKIENEEIPKNFGMNDGDYINVDTSNTLIDEN